MLRNTAEDHRLPVTGYGENQLQVTGHTYMTRATRNGTWQQVTNSR
ncbi:hypothetical protein [Niastella populi]|nr:hypothetical protein [Niastella populi]